MSCKSPSLERVVQKSGKAKKQVENLNKQLIDLELKSKKQFNLKINSFSKRAKIKDFRELIYNSGIKTEYSHEFSLDKIAPIISSALEAVAQSLTGSVMQVLTSPKAISSYSDLVVSISEAAKSNSSAANNLTFSANRIAPGVFAFLSANSVSIKDKDTFGEEAVTATSIFYSLNNSIDDLKQSANFDLAYLDTELLLKFKHIQVGYVDDLARGEITIAVWNEKNQLIEQTIQSIKKRLDLAKFKNIVANANENDMPVDASLFNTETTRRILEDSVLQLEKHGSIYRTALEDTRIMLNNPFF